MLLLFLMLLVHQGAELTVASFAVPLGLIASFLVAHVAVRRFAPQADPALLPLVFLLAGIGICFVLRLTPAETALKQVVWLFAAIACLVLVIVLVPSIERLGQYRYVLLVAGLLLLALPMAPGIGREYYGSRIWLSVGGFSFQPGELAKICIVLFLASYLADHRELLSTLRRTRLGVSVPNFRTMVPLLAMWVVAMLVIVFEKDLGSALLLFGIFLAMVYVSTGRLSYVIIGLALAAVGCVGLYFMFDHVQTRVAIWLDPFADVQNSGYQLVQSLYSLADGGLFGSGIGRGLGETIPMVESDFIFSAIGEEMGLLGASGVIILYLLLCIRGFATAARAKSDVAAFTAAGLTCSLGLQAFIIVGGVTGLIPLTGITLPFMSQGGSSLISSMVIVGLLLCAGNEGTGLSTEMTGTMQAVRVGPKDASGVLGRAALGRRLTFLVAFLALLFALLIARLTYVQVIEAQELQERAGNNHTLLRQAQAERGAILTSDNVTLAESVMGDDGTYSRVYPQGDLAAHVVGYYSQQYGTSGVEASESATLVGEENFETLADAVRSAAGLSTNANDVVLTLNSKVQQTAQDVLKGETGAVVALDTATGAVLAEASTPTYDANSVGDYLSGSKTGSNLLNRATGSLYAPGSTFKALTLAAALDTGKYTLDSTISSPSSMNIGGAAVTTHRDSGTITLKQALAISSNTAFGQVAAELGANTLVEYAERFGFGDASLAQDFPVATSLMPDPSEMTEWETAWAGDGQPVGEHDSPAGPQATVMQMAVAMAALCNDGTVLRPYVVDHVLSSAGKTVSTTAPSVLGKAVSATTSKELKEALEEDVRSGTGAAAQIDGVRVMGKTGTAETGAAKDDAWFVCTGEAGGKSVTVAVLIEQAEDEGATTAAPKARTVLKKALEELGAL